MKKEKQVRSYKRKTKSGKTVIVKAHTAKYEAADEKAKEVSKKPGAGKELEERKKKPAQLELPFDKEEEKKVLDEVKETAEKESTKKSNGPKSASLYPDAGSTKGNLRNAKSALSALEAKSKKSKSDLHKIETLKKDISVMEMSTKKVRPVGSGTNGPTPKEKKSEKKATKTSDSKSTSEPAFTAAEFKEWYRGTGSAADKKVAKALRAQLGRAGYRKLEDEAIDGYSARGHLSMFKRVSGGSEVSAKTSKSGAKEKAAEAPSKSRSGVTELSMVKDKTLRDKIIKHVQAVTDGEYSANDYTWKDALAAARHPSEGSLRSSLQKKFGLSVKDVESKPYSYYNEGKGTPKSSASKANAPTKKPLTSYQKHAINALLNQPGWSMSKAEKYVRTLSDKEVQRLAHKDI